MIAERFPDHAVLGEEFEAAAIARLRRRSAGCSIRSTARPTTRTACRSSARRWRSRSTASRGRRDLRPDAARAVHGRARAGRLAERTPLRVSSADTLIDSLLVTGFHYESSRTPRSSSGSSRRSSSVARGPPPGIGGARPLLRRGRALRVEEAGGPRLDDRRRTRSSVARRQRPRHQRPDPCPMLETIAEFDRRVPSKLAGLTPHKTAPAFHFESASFVR